MISPLPWRSVMVLRVAKLVFGKRWCLKAAAWTRASARRVVVLGQGRVGQGQVEAGVEGQVVADVQHCPGQGP